MLELIIGPMFSGKSTECIRRINRLRSIGKRVLVINSCKDTRCKGEIQTHDKKTTEAMKVNSLVQVSKTSQFKNSEVIVVDEGQFFTDIMEVRNWVSNDNKHCIVCGLDGDFMQNKFGKILDLIPFCEKVDKLHGYCSMCNDGTPGYFTIRIDSQTNQEVIGSNDIYKCVCRNHLNC